MFSSNNWVQEMIERAARILDAGCGTGAEWWSNKPADAQMIAVDLIDIPSVLPPNTEFFLSDIESFCARREFEGYFSLIMAEHVLEHFADPPQVAALFNRVLSMNGLVHVGIPDASMFSDRFFRLIHPEGGGHISQLTLESLKDIMAVAGFDLLIHRPWEECWAWLKNNYDWRARGIRHITQDEVNYIADVFLRELTPEKGYYYGWECVFEKKRDAPLRTSPDGSGI